MVEKGWEKGGQSETGFEKGASLLKRKGARRPHQTYHLSAMLLFLFYSVRSPYLVGRGLEACYYGQL